MKPQPIAEIVVTQDFPNAPSLHILAATPDADNWVRDNVEEYGVLFTPERTARAKDFVLFVSANYNVDDIATYIRTMGTPEQADLSTFDPADTDTDSKDN